MSELYILDSPEGCPCGDLHSSPAPHELFQVRTILLDTGPRRLFQVRPYTLSLLHVDTSKWGPYILSLFHLGCSRCDHTFSHCWSMWDFPGGVHTFYHCSTQIVQMGNIHSITVLPEGSSTGIILGYTSQCAQVHPNPSIYTSPSKFSWLSHMYENRRQKEGTVKR